MQCIVRKDLSFGLHPRLSADSECRILRGWLDTIDRLPLWQGCLCSSLHCVWMQLAAANSSDADLCSTMWASLGTQGVHGCCPKIWCSKRLPTLQEAVDVLTPNCMAADCTYAGFCQSTSRNSCSSYWPRAACSSLFLEKLCGNNM
ncbi:unnamed protein product [Symbiodinium sp. KB8]|nr:unnamed protein product [Symbiodinium sp. KB8]